MATINKVEITGGLDGSQFRVVIHASGEPLAQAIEDLDLWVDGLPVPIPQVAYAEAWNANPASIEIRSSAGVVKHRLPPDAWLPIISLVVGGHDGRWAVILFLEKHVPVVSFVRTLDGEECHAFDERYQVTCEVSKQDSRDEDVDPSKRQPRE